MTLGQIWYYMIYLSNNDFFKFWGSVDYFANTKSVFFLYIGIAILTIVISMFVISLFTKKISKSLSFFIGTILTIFVFQAVVSKSSEIRSQAIAQAEQLYKEDPNKFKDWKEYIK